jgi:hypothetical protein
MTWGYRAASAVALLALAACSSTADLAGGDTHESAASGVSTTAHGEAGEGNGDGDGDEDQSDTAEDGPTLDLGGQPLSACDPWAQDCPAADKCSWEQVAGVAQTRCVPVEPDAKLPGEPCNVFGDPTSGYDDCVLGAICAHVDARNQGMCLALCGGSPAQPVCADELATCDVCPDCPSVCLPLCDPLAQDCEAGFACTPSPGSFACQPSEQLGTGELGDPCEYGYQCSPGNACIDASKVPGCPSEGCCSPFCSTSEPDCPNALVCVPWFDTDSPPLPDLGVCQAL